MADRGRGFGSRGGYAGRGRGGGQAENGPVARVADTLVEPTWRDGRLGICGKWSFENKEFLKEKGFTWNRPDEKRREWQWQASVADVVAFCERYRLRVPAALRADAEACAWRRTRVCAARAAIPSYRSCRTTTPVPTTSGPSTGTGSRTAAVVGTGESDNKRSWTEPRCLTRPQFPP